MLKSRKKVVLSRTRDKVTANSYQSISQSMGPSGGGMSGARGGGASTRDSFLYGIMPDDPTSFQQVYRDIYYNDPVAGASVDLMSTMPWSQFDLSGASKEQLNVFNENVERMNITELMPALSRDYLALGAHVSTMVYKSDLKGFTDIIPHDYGMCTVQEVPLYSADPLITLRVPKEFKEFASSNQPYMKKIQERLGINVCNALRSNAPIELQPASTLYVPRTNFSTDQKGQSIYRRIIPVYLLERLLYRGTLTEATRRQRSTMHIQAGSEDSWIPTQQDLTDIVSLFQQAELDPISAIVATRGDINTQEIRQGGDFWKYTDIIDQTNEIKMKALGINSSFLDGDASFSAVESALSVFLENLRQFREMATRFVLTGKIFPVLSVVNGFYKEEYSNRVTASQFNDSLDIAVNDSHKLIIPQVYWHKQLQPSADMEQLQILGDLAERGVPIGLRMWAAAGGLNIDNAVADLEEDVELRKKIQKITENSGLSEEEASIVVGGYDAKGRLLQDSVTGKPVPLLAREFDELGEVSGKTKSGRRRYLSNQRQANGKLNDMVIKACQTLQDPNNQQKALSRAKHAFRRMK